MRTGHVISGENAAEDKEKANKMPNNIAKGYDTGFILRI